MVGRGTQKEKKRRGSGSRRVSKEGRVIDISHEELVIFGLTSAEGKILLGLLEQGPTRVSQLSRVTGLSHTTVHAAIRRLAEQGLVRRISKGYSSVWTAVRLEQVRERIKEALLPFSSGLSKEELEREIGVEVEERGEFFFFEGTQNMLQVYQWLLINHRNERFFALQTPLAAKLIQQKLTSAEISAIKDSIAENKVILSILLPVFNLNSDVLVASDMAILANWEEDVLILVQNKYLVVLLQNVLRFSGFSGEILASTGYVWGSIERGEEA
jgi:sugar-specific transcriptional regulator TrmB